MGGRRSGCAIAIAIAGALGLAPTPAAAQVPTAPFAAFQYATAGCIEVGVRPGPPYNQPRPFVVPDGYDVTSGYPPFGYDPTGFTPTSGTNACRYKFYDKNPRPDPSMPVDPTAVVIGYGYCVQWAAGQLSGTGYDPEPWTGTIRNDGYVRRIVQSFFPATNLPALANDTQRAGAVAMAVHFFTDGIVLPPNYQTPAIYTAVSQIVAAVLMAGPLPPTADPTPTIDGPTGGNAGALLGPYTIGANATGPVTVTVTGADAFTDAAGTLPFASGSTLSPGGQIWIRSTLDAVVIHAAGPVPAAGGTLMIGDPAVRVQSMALTPSLTLVGESTKIVSIVPGDPPRIASQISAVALEVGDSVFDRLDVSGLDPINVPAPLTVTLYGPLPPDLLGGCDGADWSDVGSLPVADTVTVEVSANGSIETPERVVDAPGCYSFGAAIQPMFALQASFPPGDPTETLLAIPKVIPPALAVTSQASANALDAGGTVSDHITVSGLLAGRRLTITSSLYGPVAPGSAGTCDGINWLGALPTLVVAFPAVTVTSAGSVDTPAARLDQPGCYSFGAIVTNDQLTGGAEPDDWVIGEPSEIIQVTGAVSPPPPDAPDAAVSVDAATEARAGSDGGARADGGAGPSATPSLATAPRSGGCGCDVTIGVAPSPTASLAGGAVGALVALRCARARRSRKRRGARPDTGSG